MGVLILIGDDGRNRSSPSADVGKTWKNQAAATCAVRRCAPLFVPLRRCRGQNGVKRQIATGYSLRVMQLVSGRCLSLPSRAQPPYPQTSYMLASQTTRVQTFIRPSAIATLCSLVVSSRSRCSRVVACTSSSVAIPNFTMSGSKALVTSATCS